MNHCPQYTLVQDWLDGALDDEAAARFEAHLDSCGECAPEVAAYRRVWDELAAMPLLDPRPGFADRVMARAFPAPAPLWWRALGWAYAGSLALTGAALAAAFVVPAPRAWSLAILAAGARSLASAFTFVTHSLGAAVTAVSGTGETAHVASMARRVATPLLQAEFVALFAAALLACAALLWWMRPRDTRSAEEVGHVGILGF